MAGVTEIRDPLHVFVKLEGPERAVLDCRPFQRLRHVHQLAMSYLVYPGATHRRFEHSLGVMELATRIYDVVCDAANLTDEVRDIVPAAGTHARVYWRQVLRMAALCHDTGHLPFSHAAEERLLPDGVNHEILSEAVIRSDEMSAIWKEMHLDADDIVALAVEPGDGVVLPPWKAILNEMITGAVFGADRMDYLLRDSLHSGVAYGRFDHARLIDTLRILPAARQDESESDPGDPTPQLGVTLGGLQSAEALVLARYFMFSQVYLHRVRRIYDKHLEDFLVEWLPAGHFSGRLDDHLAMTDAHVTVAMLQASADTTAPGHIHARRVVNRDHFKVLYAPTPIDVRANAAGAKQLFDAACEKYGSEAVRYDRYSKGGSTDTFPVLTTEGVQASNGLSDVLGNVPIASSHYVFIQPELAPQARRWKDTNLADIIEARPEDEEEGDT
ncbi:MAG: HD domain-containing protein [Solirubrobacteraceae bacterium]|nr:HD domain-containing protein [Solirubrobacteraceae bacterium]